MQGATAVSGGQRLSSDEAQLMKACQQLESFFWEELLAAMDKTIPEDGLTGGSFARDVYRDMLDQQYATLLAQGGSGNSLAAVLYHQLYSQLGIGENGGSGD